MKKTMTMKRMFSRAAATLALIVLTTATAWAETTGNWNDVVAAMNIGKNDAEAKAAAVPQSEDGSTVYISTAEQLACFAYFVNNDYKITGSAGGYYCGRTVELLADIDLSAHYWTAIGTNIGHYFNGFFHGNGHVITGMNIVLSYLDDSLIFNDNDGNLRIGLFGHLRGRNSGTGTACITDLTLKDFSVNITTNGSTAVYVGGLVGFCNNNFTTTSITNCCLVNGTVYCNDKQINTYLGGLVAEGTPTTCSNNYRYNVSTMKRSITVGPISGESVANCAALTVSGHGSVALGGNVGVMSGGKIYAASGQTVTLSATPDAGYMVGYTTSGVTVTDGAFTMPANDDATVAATFTPDPAHFSVSGDEYTIHTAEGWGVFCDALQDNDTYNRFSGKTVYLGANIEVSRMAGSQYHDFCGTFDGYGNTLTFNHGSSGSYANDQYAAPFYYVSTITVNEVETPATIRNLHVAGDIYTTAKYAAGIVGRHWGTLNIENCVVSTVIHSDINGDGTHAGIEAVSSGTLNITGCVFDGKILTTGTNATTNCGGFVGWGSASVTNSLYAPATLGDGETEVGDGSSNPTATFVRYGEGATATITNSYYTRTLGTAQGKATRTVTAGEGATVSVALTGDQTAYDVSGITPYAGGGIRRGGTLYYGEGDLVTLTVTNTRDGAPSGYHYDGYTVSDGDLGDGNVLIMPDADVTVTGSTDLRSTGALVTVSYVDANGSHEAQAVALDGYETVTTQFGSQYIDLAEGWYFVGADIDYTGKCIRPQGEINLILGNGKTMHIGTADNPTNDNGIERGVKDITIYGQSLANATAGTLSYVGSGTYGIIVNNYTQQSGNVSISSTSSYNNYGINCDNATINGGTFNATGGKWGIKTNTNVTINGGNVNATGTEYGIKAGNGITLGWTNAADRITANSYYGTVKVADGHKLYDGNGNFLGGTVSDLAAVNGKTLRPALSTAYIDADGSTHAATDAIVLSPDQTTLGAHNYVALGTLNYTSGITLGGDVTLILADGCQMNVGSSSERINGTGIEGMGINGNHDLTITSQTLGTGMGTLSVYNTGDRNAAIWPRALTINGGDITADANGEGSYALMTYNDVTINGGTVSTTATGTNAPAIFAADNFNYNGGNFTANATNENAIWAVGGNYTFSWRNPADRITIGATGLYTSGGTATFSKAMTDGTGCYSGDVTDLNALAGVTLQPCAAATFAKEGYATYYDSQYDATLPAGVIARVIARVVTADEGYGTLTYATIADGDDTDNKVVPAGTAVMLQTAATDAAQTKPLIIAAKTAAAYDGDNLLHGSDTETTTTGYGKHYKLSYSTTGTDIGWYWGADNGASFTSGAHKAWLVLPNTVNAHFFGLPDWNSETTSLSEKGIVNSEKFAAAVGWYDMQGRKLSGKPSKKGLYINNGRKTVIK